MFLTLPRELRNEIYHHLWSSTPVRALSAGHTMWYNCAPMPLGLTPNPIPAGLPPWLLTSPATLDEGLQQVHISGTLEVNLRATAFPLLLSPSSARHVRVTLRLAPVRASLAAVYREIDAGDARELARLVRGMGNARRIEVCVGFDQEANLAKTLGLSPVDLVTQDWIEVVVSGVKIGSAGEFAVIGAFADLVDGFDDADVQVGRNVPPLPPPVGFQTGPGTCSWWCVFRKE